METLSPLQLDPCSTCTRLPTSSPILVLAGGIASLESLAITLGSSGHGAWLAYAHERHRLIWHKFNCTITPTGMLSSLSWPKDLAEPGPHGEVRVPQSPLLSSRHLQHYSPTLTTHLSLTFPSSSNYAWNKEGKNAATAKTGRGTPGVLPGPSCPPAACWRTASPPR